MFLWLEAERIRFLREPPTEFYLIDAVAIEPVLEDETVV